MKKKERVFDPRKLDVAAFAQDAGSLQGEWPATSLGRMAEMAAPEAPAEQWPPVRWSAEGELHEPRGGESQVWLHLKIDASAALTCQRCLKPVTEALALEHSFRFAKDEATAAELDANSDEDVLELSRSFDLAELIEDEILLALPLVPRHDSCPQPLAVPASVDEEIEEERPNPFAALAALKKGGGTQ
ncbi:DUF177 domain-containing protein [Pelomonas sp. SE-A7]|uniref:YceD family protein n=1 Tax=Pelomonas sp. SE-A7 TaxID=3054953 RepID=UPI00259CF1EA|nr:DUF177 domain-containing protein [Pelomonas sp. SE-A7]MDM4767497.1 DUF177 domain-containing protein [Pelomonas sp. SE-A7]